MSRRLKLLCAIAGAILLLLRGAGSQPAASRLLGTLGLLIAALSGILLVVIGRNNLHDHESVPLS